jgi:uncharacterized protein YndB with AHSA1/START domain
MKREITVERFYPYPPERVWRAITDPKLVSQWLMETDFQPAVGHRFQFRARGNPLWDGVVDCEVVEVEPPRKLVYTWTDSWKIHRNSKPMLVTWRLDPVEGGTRLRLTHTGFHGLAGFLLRAMMSNGWGTMLRTRLVRVIESLD